MNTNIFHGRNLKLARNVFNKMLMVIENVVGMAENVRMKEILSCFQVRVDQMSKQWSGSLQVGLTTLAISDSSPVSSLPSAAHEIRSKVTWVVSGSEVKKNGLTIKENYAPSLERLEVGYSFSYNESSN